MLVLHTQPRDFSNVGQRKQGTESILIREKRLLNVVDFEDSVSC